MMDELIKELTLLAREARAYLAKKGDRQLELPLPLPASAMPTVAGGYPASLADAPAADILPPVKKERKKREPKAEPAAAVEPAVPEADANTAQTADQVKDLIKAVVKHLARTTDPAARGEETARLQSILRAEPFGVKELKDLTVGQADEFKKVLA